MDYDALVDRVSYLKRQITGILLDPNADRDENGYLTKRAETELYDWIDGDIWWVISHWNAYDPEEVENAYQAVKELIRLANPTRKR